MKIHKNHSLKLKLNFNKEKLMIENSQIHMILLIKHMLYIIKIYVNKIYEAKLQVSFSINQ